MKAIVFTQYGSADLLQFKEVEKPTPKANEVLVRIHAASVNPLDWHIMRADPFLARLDAGLFKPKYTGLGADIAGTVEAVGSSVTHFKPGDEVFGDTSATGLGGFAEYVCVLENRLAFKPANVSFEAAAAVPVAGITALQGLVNTGRIQAGESVLVNGASGGVGTFAVQIAKAYGAEVTGVCSTRNLDMVRSIGADHVIDYTRQDFTRSGQKYNLIYDAVGNRTIGDLKRALSDNGRAVVAGFTKMSLLFQMLVVAPLVSRRGSQKIGLMPTASPNQKDLQVLGDLLENGAIKPVIDRCYPLSETPEAIRYLETMRARGKVIVSVVQNDSHKQTVIERTGERS